ncbi:Anaphase-promoting complex subunit 23 [Irineochytrium annulatum]|nr:Anaphase-promoting complex subunit 23 [Irineochytrium annulatum]
MERALRLAFAEMSRRGLYQAAKWAAEQADAFGVDIDLATSMVEDDDDEPATLPMNAADSGKYMLALSYFQVREFERAAHTLAGNLEHPDCLFLHLYSRFMAWGKKSFNKTDAQKRELTEIYAKLLARLDEGETDAFLLYLFAVVCNELNLKDEALKAALKSVTRYQYNYSAWKELASCIQERESLNDILPQLPSTTMTKLFLVEIGVTQVESVAETENKINKLRDIFPDSPFLTLQYAMSLYWNRRYVECVDMFKKLYDANPHMIDFTGEYGNALFVLNRRPELGYLANRCNGVDRFREETCNYYSLQGEREKAIEYFQRATKLNQKNSLPWTLIGHEYVEMTRSHAAVDAYRRAIGLLPAKEINNRDYAAWHSLGQIYKILRMNFYSLYYLKRAAALKPYDSICWLVLADVYEALNRDDEAIRCYKRALSYEVEDRHEVLTTIARVYKRACDVDNAAKYYLSSYKTFQSQSRVRIRKYTRKFS